MIRRNYKTDGWPTTLMLVNAIGYLAEAAYHHPDLAVTWGRVQVKLSTHSAGGITDKDFALARQIEDHVLWRPAAATTLTGTPNKWVRSGDPARMTRAERRSVGASARAATPRRVLFVTGRLAEPALRRVLAETALPFAYEVAVLKITVAALMTTTWIARNLDSAGRHRPRDDPRLVRRRPPGDCREGRRAGGKRARRIFASCRLISGGPRRRDDYGAWDIEIVAEINNAPKLTRQDILKAADYFHESGADIIDIGCTPGTRRSRRSATSSRELRRGRPARQRRHVRCRARFGRPSRPAPSSCSASTDRTSTSREDLAGTGARVVAVPDLGGALDTLEPTLETLARRGVPYLIDPILEPIGHGFTASIERYAETRRRHPEAEMLMGIGNLTELTAADSTGVHAVLIAICQELGHPRGADHRGDPLGARRRAEVDVARRLMHYAVTQRTIPKGVDDRLVTDQGPGRAGLLAKTSCARCRPASPTRTSASSPIASGITVLNNERFVRSTRMSRASADLFAQLGVDEATHAFYLGTELAKAGLAVDARQDLPPGRTALVGLPDAGRTSSSRNARGSPGARSGRANRARAVARIERARA